MSQKAHAALEEGPRDVAAQKSYIASKKPTHLGVSAPAERPRDADAESEGNKQEQRVKDQKVKEVRSPNQEVLDQRSQDLSWRINR